MTAPTAHLRSRGANKVWHWVFNGYAIVLFVALVYGLIQYLMGTH